MDRKEFLSQLGLTSAVVFMGACMAGCSKDGSTPAPSNVDFTLNLSDTANAALGSAGGFVYKNNIIIARTQSNSYIAV
jgi:cytochrome b6-f complex iron-sulfur subunit